MDARGEALARLIEDNPEDVEAYRAYGDYLEEQGDPRGKLTSLQMLRERLTDRTKLDHLDAKLAAFFEEHREHFLGKLAKLIPPPTASRRRRLEAPKLEWRCGFIYKAEPQHLEGATLHAFFEHLLAHPSGRFVVELRSVAAADPAFFAMLAVRLPRSLRRLELAAGEGVAAIWPRLELLEHLSLSTSVELGDVVLPNVREVRLDINDPRSLRSLATARWPKLEGLRLRIWPETATVAEILAVLDRDLPALRSLQLQFHDPLPDVLLELSRLPAGRRLAVLELASMSSEIADALARSAFALDELRVPDSMYPDPRPRFAHLAKRLALPAR